MTSARSTRAGVVDRLLRYPVKSMLGEEIPVADVTERGLAHDRRLALVDKETGKVASAKHPRLWHRLLTMTATAGTSAVRITTADGKELRSTDPGVDDALSEIVGRPVLITDTPPHEAALDRADPAEVLRHDGTRQPVGATTSRIAGASPQGTFFDFAPVHLMTTSTIARIAELTPHGDAQAERYRPNLVIRTPHAQGFTEDDWLDRTLCIGADLVLRVIARTPRCAVPTLAHGALPTDTAALRVLAEHNRITPMASMGAQPCAGVYAQVLRPGRIVPGDAVHRS